MATDQDGRTIAVGDAMMVSGRVRRIDTNELVLILGDGENGMVRVKAGDTRLVSAGGGGGGGVSDGDKGDIIVSGTGTVWTFDTSIVTPAAKTVLDDATVANMVDTLGGAASTGSGGLVRQTGPIFVSPKLGTPTSGNLTNCTGLVASTGLTGIVPPANLGTGATGGTTRFLREDSTYAVPSASASIPAFINIDLGDNPSQSGSFTFTIATSIVGSLVEIFESAETIGVTGELGDRLECDMIRASGIVTATTSATVYWNAAPGFVSGTRRFAYRITSL